MVFHTNLYNVFITSAAFLCLFTAFQTTCLVSQNVLESTTLTSDRVAGDAFVSVTILYASLATLNWIAPLVVIAVGERLAMFIGSCCYVFYVAVFLEPRDWLLYSVSVLNGFGAAVLWTAQGTYITRCSDNETINRHFSLFWSIFQTSQIWGGLFAYYTLTGVIEIDHPMRHRLFGVLVGIGAVGWFLFAALRKPEEQFDIKSSLDVFKVEPDLEIDGIEDENDFQGCTALWQASKKTFHRSLELVQTRMMVCIMVVSAYTGLIAIFHLALFSTCIGHTLAFGTSAKAYIGLVGVYIGLGEVIGSTLMHLRRWVPPHGLITTFGFSSSLGGALILVLVLPTESPIRSTDAVGIIPISIHLCMFAAFLFGISGSVWNTQICSLIGSVYGPRGVDVPVAFAIYKCLQAIATAAVSAYSGYLELHWQLIIFVVFTCASLISFIWAYSKHVQLDDYQSMGVKH